MVALGSLNGFCSLVPQLYSAVPSTVVPLPPFTSGACSVVIEGITFLCVDYMALADSIAPGAPCICENVCSCTYVNLPAIGPTTVVTACSFSYEMTPPPSVTIPTRTLPPTATTTTIPATSTSSATTTSKRADFFALCLYYCLRMVSIVKCSFRLDVFCYFFRIRAGRSFFSAL
jgi:hypothetical protein